MFLLESRVIKEIVAKDDFEDSCGSIANYSLPSLAAHIRWHHHAFPIVLILPPPPVQDDGERYTELAQFDRDFSDFRGNHHHQPCQFDYC